MDQFITNDIIINGYTVEIWQMCEGHYEADFYKVQDRKRIYDDTLTIKSYDLDTLYSKLADMVVEEYDRAGI